MDSQHRATTRSGRVSATRRTAPSPTIPSMSPRLTARRPSPRASRSLSGIAPGAKIVGGLRVVEVAGEVAEGPHRPEVVAGVPVPGHVHRPPGAVGDRRRREGLHHPSRRRRAIERELPEETPPPDGAGGASLDMGCRAVVARQIVRRTCIYERNAYELVELLAYALSWSWPCFCNRFRRLPRPYILHQSRRIGTFISR